MIKIESYKKGALLSIFFNGAAKAILFVLTIIIAHYFGNNVKTDIYFFIYSSMILFSGFINAVDVAVLIPESMRIREKEGAASATSFLNYFLRIYLIIGIVFVVGMYLFGTTVFGSISKFSAEDIALYKNYFFIGSFYFLFQIITGYLNNILTSLKFFTLPMIISGVNSCIIIAGIVLLRSNYDVLSVLISGVIAYVVNLIILLIVLKKAADWNFKIIRSAIKRKVWNNILFAELGQLATTVSSYFPLYLLSGFGGGIISSMSYGKAVADIPTTLLTAQVANVAGIKLNEQAAANDHAGMNDTFLRSSKLLIFIMVPISCFMFVAAFPIVDEVYKRGSFDHHAVFQTFPFLMLFASVIFCIAVNAMVSRLFIAMQAMKQALGYQLLMNIFLILSIWFFTKNYGAEGYPYGVILVNTVNYLLMYFICKKLLREINYGSVLLYTLLILAINIPIVFSLYQVFRNFDHTTGSATLVLILFVITYAVLLLIINHFFKLNKDLSIVIHRILKAFN